MSECIADILESCWVSWRTAELAPETDVREVALARRGFDGGARAVYGLMMALMIHMPDEEALEAQLDALQQALRLTVLDNGFN